MSKRSDYKRDDHRRDGYDYKKGSSAYRAEGRRRDDDDDDDDDHRSRDRSPLRPAYDRQDYSSGSYQPSSGKQKLAFGFDKKGEASNDPKKGSGIQMKLGGSSKTPKPPQKHTIASVFNNDDDDEPEEMPAEARMRMRNIGRETPTSAGPNSFGKTKQGFCDSKKIFEKTLKKAMEDANK